MSGTTTAQAGNPPSWIDWSDTTPKQITNMQAGNGDGTLKWLTFDIGIGNCNCDDPGTSQSDYITGDFEYVTNPDYLWSLDSTSGNIQITPNANAGQGTSVCWSDCYNSDNQPIDNCTTVLDSSICPTTSSPSSVVGYGTGTAFCNITDVLGSKRITRQSNTGFSWTPSTTGAGDPAGTGAGLVANVDSVASGTSQTVFPFGALTGDTSSGYSYGTFGCADKGDGATGAPAVDSSQYPTQISYRNNTISASTQCNYGTASNVNLTCDETIANNPVWQLIDAKNALRCCASTQANGDAYPMCAGSAFDPTLSGNLCLETAQEVCSGNWDDADCTSFIVNSPMSAKAVQATFINYVTDESRDPQNYISSIVAANNPNSLSAAYYAAGGTRDDSGNTFFSETIPNMCNNSPGACNEILNYFCQEFSRNDIATGGAIDQTLVNLCGCHLSTCDTSTNTGACDLSTSNLASPLGGEKMSLITADGSLFPPSSPFPSPYYTDITGGTECDPLCIDSAIQSNLGKCVQPTCIIDNVTINVVDSTTGGTGISQNCTGGTCYISNVDINEVDSNVGGITNITQNCSACYTFDDNIEDATEVDCSTLSPTTDSGNGSNGGTTTTPPTQTFGEWFAANKKTVIIIVVVIALIVAITGFGFGLLFFGGKDASNGKSVSNVSSVKVPSNITSENYWEYY